MGAVMGIVVLGAGCATKKYVRQNIEPMQQRVEQMDTQQQKQGQNIDQLGKDVQENDTEISAAKERIGTVETRVGDAFSKIDQNQQGLNELRTRVANLDDYRAAQQLSVPFGFDRDTLTSEASEQLRQIAAATSGAKRYFVTVEGFTDQVGSSEYNYSLSQRRADRVVRYLVAEVGIPVHRIYVIGLGEQRLVETSNSREARARNRRVEVTVYSADSAGTTSGGSN